MTALVTLAAVILLHRAVPRDARAAVDLPRGRGRLRRSRRSSRPGRLRRRAPRRPGSGCPQFTLPPTRSPRRAWGMLPAFLPVVLVLIAENVGHIRGVAQLTDPTVNRLTGRALLADGWRP